MRFVSILAALAIISCKGSTGPAGAAGESALISVAPVAAGASCAAGGFVIKVGIDTNGNGVLDPSEVTSTSYLCNGTNGLSGADGTSGSNGTNGTNGTNGANGTDGTNGAGAFVTSTPLPSGDAHCPFGGALLTYGVGTLGADGGVAPGDQVTGTAYICSAASIWTVCASGCPYTSITAALAALPAGGGAATITVGPGTFTEAGITLNENVQITGAGAGSTIVQAAATAAAATDRVFHVSPGVTAVLEGLTIQNGQSGPATASSVPNGGGILNEGNLTVRRCAVTGNLAGAGFTVATGAPGAGGSGGGIYSGGTFAIGGSNVTPNLVLEDSTIDGNAAGQGGGTSTATCNDMSGQCGNTGAAGGFGGGIAIGTGTLSVKGSTIANNTAGAGGFGCLCALAGGGCFNSATIGFGGGIALLGGSGQIESSTIAGNSPGVVPVSCSPSLSANLDGPGGAYIKPSATAVIVATTFSGNLASPEEPSGLGNDGTVTLFANAFDDDCSNTDSGGGTSLGYNLMRSTEGFSCPHSAADLVSNTPMLGSLSDNGGPTQTVLPQAGSPLIDAIPPAHCNDYPIAAVDQRGLPRPAGSGCDIGAVEVQ